jgi:hypothetical protein
MPEWIMGVAGVIALPLIVFIWKSLQVRQRVVRSGVKIGSMARSLWRGYDIPLLTGSAEESLKERVLSTIGDFIYGMYCGLTGKDCEKNAPD